MLDAGLFDFKMAEAFAFMNANANVGTTLTAGEDNMVSFTFTDGLDRDCDPEDAIYTNDGEKLTGDKQPAIRSDGDEGPWMGICKGGYDLDGTDSKLIGDMWFRCKESLAGGFLWPADLIPEPGNYTMVMVPNGRSNSVSQRLATVLLKVGKKCVSGGR